MNALDDDETTGVELLTDGLDDVVEFIAVVGYIALEEELELTLDTWELVELTKPVVDGVVDANGVVEVVFKNVVVPGSVDNTDELEFIKLELAAVANVGEVEFVKLELGSVVNLELDT